MTDVTAINKSPGGPVPAGLTCEHAGKQYSAAKHQLCSDWALGPLPCPAQLQSLSVDGLQPTAVKKNQRRIQGEKKGKVEQKQSCGDGSFERQKEVVPS